MASSDLVMVLSHHAYPEGLPIEAGQIVPQRSPAAVAAAVEKVLGNPALYQAMSLATPSNFDQLQAPPRGHEVFNHWLGRTPADERWLSEHSIASADYELPRAALNPSSSHSPYARVGLAAPVPPCAPFS
jgi:hypothetical protein